jgi:hypothetical protein
LGGYALHRWTRLLRRRVRAAGMATSDHCFGIVWSGHMTRERVRRLLAELPDGESEVYFHPAVARDAMLRRLMPDYEHEAELAALLDLAPDPEDANLLANRRKFEADGAAKGTARRGIS